MLKVAIVDDLKEALSSLMDIVRETLEPLSDSYKIDTFMSGEELLSQKESYDILFLDIEMPGMDGIKTGEAVLNRYPDTIVIMATAATHRFKEAFFIRAFRFITKPFVKDEIDEALHSAIRLVNTNESIELFYQRIPYKISYKQIQYIKSYNGYCEFCIGDKMFRKEITLQEVEDTFPGVFFARIHRQYVVNLMWITKYVNGEVYFNNEKIKVSVRRLKEFEAKYVSYDIKYKRK